MKRTLFRMGCLFGIIFCLAIAPLVLGAGFPATLLVVFALYRLSGHEARESVADVMDHNRVPQPLQ